MANGWGGSRTPANPAVVSNPGSGSARTDGGVMDANSPPYGEGVDLENMKAMGQPGSAPMPGGGQPAPQAMDTAGLTPMGAPSAQPGVPVTTGADAGPGAGIDALGLPQDPVSRDKADMVALGPSIQAMIYAAGQPDATPSFRALVRQAVRYIS